MPATGEIRFRGLRELQLALKKCDVDLSKQLRKTLREVAEPVKVKAADKAVAEITNIGPRWSRMRVGVTSRTVYVAPASRRRGGSPRANLGGLLMDRAMQPALDESTPVIYARLERMLDTLGDHNGF